MPRQQLLERRDQLDELDDAFNRAASGSGVSVLVEAGAGLGKSALLSDAAKKAKRSGATLFSASASELERDHPFGVIRQLFGEALAAAPDREDLLAGGAAPLAWLVDSGEDTALLATRAQAGPALGPAIEALVTRLAARAPVVLAVDDLHWADDGSLRALAFVARRLTALPVVLVGTLRPSEPDSNSHLLDELRTTPNAVRLALPPLSPDAVCVLVRAEHEEADADTCAAFDAASGGNPLYLRELLLWARSEGLTGDAETVHALSRASIPALADRLGRRVERVGPEAPALAAAMAVLGDGSRLGDAAALAQLGEARAALLARGLTDIELLAHDDPVVFAHPVLRRSLYDRLPSTERQDLHRHAAERLSERGASAEKIAAQVAQLPPEGSESSAEALRAAASAALARAAPDIAVALLRRALAEDAPTPSREVLLLELGRTEFYAGDLEAVAHLEEAFSLVRGNPQLRGEVAESLCVVLGASGRWEAAVQVSATALAELESADSLTALELESTRAVLTANDPRLVEEFEQRRERLEQLAQGESWPALAIGAVLAATAAIRCEPAHRVRVLLDSALRGNRLLAERGGGGWAAAQVLIAAIFLDDDERARELCERVKLAGEESGSLLCWGTGVAYGGLLRCRRGDLDLAEADLRSLSDRITRSGMELWSASVLYTFCDAILERPSLEDYAALIDGLELDPVFTNTLGGSMLLETRGRLALSRGERERAIAVLEPCLQIQQRMGTGPGHTWVRSTLALALPEAEHERARDLVEEELALTRAGERHRDEGVTLRALGQLQPGEQGLARLEESIGVLEDAHAPLELARSCFELGVRLRRSGRRRDARVPLARAMDLASRCGAHRLVARANEELHVAGARPRRTAATGADALTPSEWRVARLVAQGHSNAEVAERLFLSMKTVEAHLMKAYRKLGLHGAGARARLIDELAEEGAT